MRYTRASFSVGPTDSKASARGWERIWGKDARKRREAAEKADHETEAASPPESEPEPQEAAP